MIKLLLFSFVISSSPRSQMMGSLTTASLVQWLSQQNMSRYVSVFERNGIRDLQDVISLDGCQLKTIGVESKRDRKALMNSIQILKDRILSSAADRSYLQQNSGSVTLSSKGKLTCTSPVHSII